MFRCFSPEPEMLGKHCVPVFIQKEEKWFEVWRVSVERTGRKLNEEEIGINWFSVMGYRCMALFQ